MLVAGPGRGPRRLQDPVCLAAPDSFLGQHLATVRLLIAIGLITAAFARGRGGRWFWCDWDGPGHFVGSPPHRVSAGIGLEMLAETLLFIRSERREYSRCDIRDIRAGVRHTQGSFAPTFEGKGRWVVVGLSWPEEPGWLIVTLGWCG